MNPTTTADQTLAQLSNWLIYSAIAVYLPAFLAHCAEWAFGSRSHTARLAAAPATRRPGRAGVASEGHTAARKGTAAGTTVLAPPAARQTAEDPAPGAAVSDPHDPRADLVGRIGVCLAGLAFLLHLASVVTRAWSVGRPPWGNMYEFSTAFALAATGTYLGLLATRKQARWLGLPVTFSVLLTLGLAVTVLYVESAQLVPALDSYWLWIHVSAAIISGGAFHTAAATTLLYLARDRWERTEASGRGQGRLAALWRRLPTAARLDNLSYRLNALVFPLWTFAVIAGAVWAEAAWGRYWGWDPKETWAFITWVAYAAYLHARVTAGWKGRRAAYLGLIAFATFVFNYYGVNIFITGLHSYAGV